MKIKKFLFLLVSFIILSTETTLSAPIITSSSNHLYHKSALNQNEISDLIDDNYETYLSIKNNLHTTSANNPTALHVMPESMVADGSSLTVSNNIAGNLEKYFADNDISAGTVLELIIESGVLNQNDFDFIASMDNLQILSAGNAKAVTSDGGLKEKQFFGNKTLLHIELPEDLMFIGKDAFASCAKLVTVKLPESIERIGEQSFSDCASLENLIMGNNVEEIGFLAFQFNVMLKDIKLSDQLKIIDYGAFMGCISLEELILPESLEVIGQGVFTYSGIENIVIPRNVEIVDISALGGCEFLQSIDVDEVNPNFTAIDGALYSKNLEILVAYPAGKIDEVIIIPEFVKEIGGGAFYICMNIREVIFPEGLIAIENSAFAHCRNLQGIDFPESLNFIGYSSFSNCVTVSEIIFSKNIVSIEDRAFWGCSALRKITFETFAGIVKVGNITFNYTNLEEIYVLDSLIESYVSNDYWARFGSIIKPLEYTVYLYSNPLQGGTVSIQGFESGGKVKAGTVLQVSAYPSDGYYLGGWLVNNGINYNQENSIFVTVDRNSNIGARFELSTKIDGVIFTDDIGNMLDRLTSKTLIASLMYNNKTEEAEKLTLIVAVYKPSGELAYIGSDSKEIGSGQFADYQVRLDMPDNEDGSFAAKGYYANVFLWDSVTYKPVSEKYIFPSSK